MDERQGRFREELLTWSEGRLRDLPWRETTDPYEVLVAEMLLQKTPAERVESIYEDFLERHPNLESLKAADVQTLADLLEPLGLQNKRAEALVEIGERLASEGVPDDETTLLELPYVGKYAANATLCFAFGEPRAVVDANVVRTYERAFGLGFDPTDQEAWKFAQEMIPEKNARRYNLALLDFGAKVCEATSPNCEGCYFSTRCAYHSTN